jgi:hypothetical protein
MVVGTPACGGCSYEIIQFDTENKDNIASVVYEASDRIFEPTCQLLVGMVWTIFRIFSESITVS